MCNIDTCCVRVTDHVSPSHDFPPHQVIHQMQERAIRETLVSEQDVPELTCVNQVKVTATDAVVRIQAIHSPTRFFTVSKRGEVAMFDANMK